MGRGFICRYVYGRYENREILFGSIWKFNRNWPTLFWALQIILFFFSTLFLTLYKKNQTLKELFLSSKKGRNKNKKIQSEGPQFNITVCGRKSANNPDL